MGRKNRQQSFNQCTIVDTADKGKSVAKTAEVIPILLNLGVPGDIVDITTFRKEKAITREKSPTTTIIRKIVPMQYARILAFVEVANGSTCSTPLN